jgi:hypothetical protein
MLKWRHLRFNGSSVEEQRGFHWMELGGGGGGVIHYF